MRALLILVAGCSSSSALEVKLRDDACRDPAWETIAFDITAKRAGSLEIDVVDRWDPKQPLETLMGPDDIRFALTRIERDRIEAGKPLSVMWAFANGSHGDEPQGSACKEHREAHRDRHWLLSSAMCTREISRVGTSGSSSSLFEASCRASQGFRPQRFVRKIEGGLAAGRWQWIAAWVWVPDGARVQFHADGDSWAFTVDGTRFTPEDSPYPAWTLRAILETE
ncbi:MAG: hypothetical protein M4D80_05735 [Myxococcota bacterium]|nr:hypothetical protein [Myxococcota bacterium]